MPQRPTTDLCIPPWSMIFLDSTIFNNPFLASLLLWQFPTIMASVCVFHCSQPNEHLLIAPFPLVSVVICFPSCQSTNFRQTCQLYDTTVLHILTDHKFHAWFFTMQYKVAAAKAMYCCSCAYIHCSGLIQLLPQGSCQ